MNYLAALLLIIVTAGATTLHVPSEYSSIFDAIGAAVNGDTVLVAAGQHCGGFGFQGKNIVVRSSGSALNTFLESPFVDWHCVMFTEGEDSTAVLEGFSITNGNFDGESSYTKGPPDHGGGIYITNSSPTIRNCRIVNCVAQTGGGIYTQHSAVNISGCTISNNAASYYAGGLFLGSSDQIDPLRIVDCSITDNSAQDGGGFYIWGGTVEVINNEISDNYCDHNGGGIGISSTNVMLFSNFISGNDGGYGGGVFIGGGITALIGNVIVQNTASDGGGIYEASSARIQMTNNTIAYNEVSPSGGWGGGMLSWKDSICIHNCIFFGNTGIFGSQLSIAGGWVQTVAEIGYCNIQYGQNSIHSDSFSVLIWDSGNIDTDPLFETGPLCDYHLSLSSPCIDAGNPAFEYNDPEDPLNPGYALWPAMGYLRNDMGAFGGAGIDYWLTVEEEESSYVERSLPLHTFPNPFSSSCTVCFQLDEASQVNLSVYDLSGRLIEVLIDEAIPAGASAVAFDASGLCSGVYLVRLVAGDVSALQRCVVVR
ncbi:MAG: T9SS type A sorting domain-containing protein [Candidatus Fermentibacteria bacterium]